MAEWSKAADCKSAGAAYEGSNPSPSTILTIYADLAQQVEHIHGKDGVPGPSPGGGSSDNTSSAGKFLRSFFVALFRQYKACDDLNKR